MNSDSPHFEADILVAGGGPAGIAAALSAARAGARVLLVEKNGFLGGMAAAAQVPAFAPFSDRTKAIVRGIGWEILTEMTRRMGRPLPEPDTYNVPQDRGRMDWAPIDVETLKIICDDLCESAGVTVLFHSFVCAVTSDKKGRIESVMLAGKQGLFPVKAQVFIDATGDADLAALAGYPFEKGDAEGGLQGMTLCFTVANGSRTAYLEYVNRTGDGYLAELVAQARAAGSYDLPDSSLVGMSFKNENVAGINMGHVYGFDPLDTLSLSQAEREGRRVVQKLMAFLRGYVPGQENLVLVSSGPQIGVRESRRIVGEYTLTLDDYLSCRTFPDDIARCAYFIDLHAVTREDAARAKSISDSHKEKQEKRSLSLPPGSSHGIPYRCLIPQGSENLLVAGRSLSAERSVQGAARIMPYCFAMGEAAGLAASLACQKHSGQIQQIDIQELQKKLRQQAAWLGQPD